ncbi:hypothetical protein GUJ93_ZPchr0010g10134 [Zizania palustris]|uniref:WRKY domain-containing protein n=1 Tax=Zizania palustris TaxID=103762 RepID=A0A8J6BH53_ZIZPA|nr:hypothetical protein GUJ93_ZPchr0010g10134 [Zizania palustris]
MADQGFRPYPPMMPAPSTAQQHVGSSSSTAVIQMAGLHSHTAYGNVDQADDVYLWRMCGQSTNQSTVLLHYQCAQENCLVQKSVALSIDGQTIETVYRGSHNHQQRSEDCVVLDPSDAAGAAGPSVPEIGNGGDQLSGSSDSEEDNDGNAGIDRDAASADANAVKRLRSKVWKEFKPIFINGKLHNAESWQPDLPVSKKSKYGHQNPLEELRWSIVSNLCPFSAMYSASFAQFLAGRNPVLNMVQQATVEEKILSVFHNEKLKLKEKITATPGGFSCH